MYIKLPKPIKRNKECSCWFLNKMGIPFSAIKCNCENPLTKKNEKI